MTSLFVDVHMKRPLLVFTLIFMLGILFNKLIPFKASTLFVLGVALFLLVALDYLRKKKSFLLPLLVLILGAFWHQLAVDAFLPVDKELLNKELAITGTVIKEPELKANYIQYTIKVDHVENQLGKTFKGKLLLKDYERTHIFSYGDQLRFNGKITEPKLPTNPGAFNYATYLRQQGIAGTVNLWQADTLKKLTEGKSNLLVSTALEVKLKLLEVSDKTLDKTDAQLMQGIIFGAKGQMKEEILEVFRQVGVAHVLAVSGLHVGIVAAGVYFFGGLFGLSTRNKQILVCLFLSFYAVMTGLKPSVIRATLMAIVLIIAGWNNRQRDWPTSMALAALTLLIINPLNLWEVGFQLSFIATWSILYLVPVLNKYVPTTSYLKNLLTVPLAAQIGTWPLIAYYFNTFSLVSILANVILVQIVGAILLLGLFSSLVGLIFLPLAEIINVSTELLIGLLLGLTGIFNELPGAYWFIKSPPIWLIVVWYLGIFFMVSYLTKQGFRQRVKIIQLRHSKKLVAANSLIIILLVWQSFGFFGGTRLQVTFLDVGQGDSTIIKTPSGQTVVIDAAGSPEYYTGNFDPGAKIIFPFLQKEGLNKIDVLILTHPHQDHVGGALALLEKLKVGLVVLPPVAANTETYEEILQTIAEQEIPVAIVEKGDVLAIDQGTEFLILHPDKAFTEASQDLNNNSIVVKLLHGQRGFLFTGDIEEPAINKLMEASNGDLKADVLKIPHHGSNTSLVPKFYDQVLPELAVISVGANNRYGHPDKGVLEALREQDIFIYRTDQQGAVTVWSDGINLEIESQKGVH